MSEAQWRVVFSEEAINDLAQITEHLTQAYCGFGQSLAEANRHIQLGIEAIITVADLSATAPLRGESRDDLLPGLRYLAWDRAVYWFHHAVSSRSSSCWPCSLAGETTSAVANSVL